MTSLLGISRLSFFAGLQTLTTPTTRMDSGSYRRAQLRARAHRGRSSNARCLHEGRAAVGVSRTCARRHEPGDGRPDFRSARTTKSARPGEETSRTDSRSPIVR
jgi:hypothetical protein